MNIKKIIFAMSLIVFISSLGFSKVIFSINRSDSLNGIFFILFGLGLLFIVSKVFGIILKKIKMPEILGAILSGIILGPFVLGSIHIPVFTNGVFPLATNTLIPVSPELFSIFVLSSVLVFFMLGLETDITVFIKYSFFGLIIGFCGIIVTFSAGAYLASIYLKVLFTSPEAIFSGLILSSTSIHLTASFLSRKSKIGLAERLTSLSSIIYDNIIVIFLFAFFAFILKFKDITNLKTIDISFNFSLFGAFVAILILFIIGLLIIDKLNGSTKKISNKSIISIIIGMIVVFSYIFSTIGLPIIVSAYILGLLLSKSRLNFIIGNNLRLIYNFLVTILFAFSGMVFDLNQIARFPGVIVTALICAVILIVLKIIITAFIGFITQFNFVNSLKIGINTIPRGEVAIILAVISYSYGLINKELYVIVFIFILFSIIIYSLFQLAFKIRVKNNFIKSETVDMQFEFESSELNQFLVSRMIENFRINDFKINVFTYDDTYYHIRKDDLVFCITSYQTGIIIESLNKETAFVKNLIYEILLDLDKRINTIIHTQEQNKVQDDLKTSGKKLDKKSNIELKDIFFEENIIINLNATNKKELLEEMASLLYKNGHIKDKNIVLNALIEREKIISTGMQRGVAIPHCKTESVDKIVLALGIKQEGINFDAIDGLPCKLFFMIISPEDAVNSHMRALMLVSNIINQEESRNKILKSNNEKDIWDFITKTI